MSNRLSLLTLHVVLLALASTGFTIVTGLWDGQFQWQYFQYISQSGWGVSYQFPYSLPVVLCYIGAYAAGAVAYYATYRGGSPLVGLAGILLCIAGLASFAFELTHWFVDHYASWIASAPIALLGLAAVVVVQHYRRHEASPEVPSEGASSVTPVGD